MSVETTRCTPDDWKHAVELEVSWRLADAEACYRRMIDTRSEFARDATLRLAHLLMTCRRFDEARGLLLAHLKGFPDDHRFMITLATLELTLGNFPRGFKAYEARRKDLGYRLTINYPVVRQPYWKGESLNGKTLLIYAEQGFGDTFQFCRYIKKLNKTRILLVVPAELRKLLTTLEFNGEFCEWHSSLFPITQNRFDTWTLLGSMPLAFRTTLSSIPASTPYLRADPAQVAAWRMQLAPGFKAGLVWAGNPAHANDWARSCPLDDLRPLFDVPGIHWYSLQKGVHIPDIDTAGLSDRITDLGSAIGDFADTAAIIANLDLVISVDTAVAHLAGALGRPCWLLLSQANDWRWLLDRDDSPWYPSIRLFRQHTPGDWSGVAARVASQLGAP